MPDELSLVFKFRRVEGQTHHSRVSKAAVDPRSWLLTDFRYQINKKDKSKVSFSEEIILGNKE